jgi:hypothetical protein
MRDLSTPLAPTLSESYFVTTKQGKKRVISRDRYKKKLNKAYRLGKVSMSTTEKDGVSYKNLSANLNRKYTKSTPESKKKHLKK